MRRKHSCITFVFLLLLIICSHKSHSQNNISLNEQVLSNSFKTDHYKKSAPRKALSFAKKSSYYNPVNYLGAGLLFFYQRVISEQLQAECTYQTSCSDFTKLSIEKYGLFKGALKGINQLSECFPGAKTEHILYYISSEEKIINKIEFAKD